MPYIPQFNKLSLQEMSYAPTLMRQQHDEEVAKQMELAEALKFDYLKQDAAGLEPILQQYNSDIEGVSKKIAQEGFSHDIKNKVLGLRSKYVGDDKIRHYKKQYADAMQGWEEQKKSLIQKGASGDLLNKQKASYFGAYEGAYDNEGMKRDFTAGRTSGVYDIAEDAKKAMTNIGKTGSIVGSSGSSVQLINDPKMGTYYKVYDSTTGQYVTTKDQIAATKEYLKAEYNPSNPTSDRGLYSKISGYTPEYIGSLVDQIGTSMQDQYYQSLPQNRTNFVGLGSQQEQQSSGDMFPTYPTGSGKSDIVEDANEDLAVLDGKQTTKPVKTKFTPGFAGAAGNPVYEAKTKTPAEAKADINSKYQNLYSKYYEGGVDPEVATRRAIATTKRNAASVTQATALTIDKKSYGGVGVTEMVLDKTLYPDADLLESGETNIFGKNKTLTKSEYIEKWGNDAWKNSKPILENSGDIFLRDPEDKLFKVNPKAFDNNVQMLQNDVLKPILAQIINPKLTEDGSNIPVELPNFIDPQSGLKVFFDVKPALDKDGKIIDPYDVSQRVVHMYGVDPETNQPVTRVEMTPSQARNELAKGIFTGFSDIKLQHAKHAK